MQGDLITQLKKKAYPTTYQGFSQSHNSYVYTGERKKKREKNWMI